MRFLVDSDKKILNQIPRFWFIAHHYCYEKFTLSYIKENSNIFDANHYI